MIVPVSLFNTPGSSVGARAGLSTSLLGSQYTPSVALLSDDYNC